MTKYYRKLSLIFIILGFIMLFTAGWITVSTNNPTDKEHTLFNITFWGHDILIMIGGFYWLKDKNRSPWWTLFASLSGFGLIVIHLLKDKSIELRKNRQIDPNIDITEFRGLDAKQLYKEAYFLFERKEFSKATAITNYLIDNYPKSKEARWAYENIEKNIE